MSATSSRFNWAHGLCGHVFQGRLESPWTGLVGGVVLGGKDFARQLLEGFKAGDLDEAA
jgi:hypothetical protein